MTDHHTRLTSGRLLAQNVVWNLAGMGLPLVAAVFAIPILIDEIGADRFGILSIAWMFVGYFSLFDLGLGRAVTNLVSESLGRGDLEDIAPTICSATLFMAGLGLIGAIIVAALTPWLVDDVLNIPGKYLPETRLSFYLLAASVPVVIIATALRGVLEAYQRFDLVNIVRIPLGLLNFVGPLLVLPFTTNLAGMVAVIAVGRLLTMAVQLALCIKIVPDLRHPRLARRKIVRRLFTFGGWMTASNIVGPLMMYFDRFLIGALLSVTAVAYYTTPYEVVTRLSLIPVALVGVLFPAFSNVSRKDPSRSARMLASGLSYLYLAVLIPTLLIVAFAHEGLDLWLGSEFASQSGTVLQMLGIGVLANSLAQIPYAMIQGHGRPDITARLHMAELPLYLAGLWWLINAYGIEGAAAAWSIRAGIDALAMFLIVAGLAPETKGYLLRFAAVMVLTVVAITLCAGAGDFTRKAGMLAVTAVSLAWATWMLLIPADEKRLAWSLMNKRFGNQRDE